MGNRKQAQQAYLSARSFGHSKEEAQQIRDNYFKPNLPTVIEEEDDFDYEISYVEPRYEFYEEPKFRMVKKIIILIRDFYSDSEGYLMDLTSRKKSFGGTEYSFNLTDKIAKAKFFNNHEDAFNFLNENLKYFETHYAHIPKTIFIKERVKNE